MLRSSRLVALAFFLCSIGSIVQLASGADAKVEAEAKKLQGDAMDVDFLSLDLKKAKAKLQDALKRCGKDKCSEPVLGALHRDLGIVLVNSRDAKGGAKEFDAAFAVDPSVTIGKDYLDNAEVKKNWEAAQAKAGPAPAAPIVTPPPATPPPVASSAGTSEGTLALEAKTAPVGFILPLVIDLPEGLDVDAVKVSYKTAAMEKYKVIDARKDGAKFVAQVPCEDTQFVGDIKLYVRAYDADKNEVDHYGTVKKPAIVKLVDKMPEGEEVPTFPGGVAPQKCTEKGDCQPGFPCDKSANKKPQGSGCDIDEECEAGLSCVVNDIGKKWCYDAGDRKKKPAGGADHKLWIGVDGQIDLLYISGADNICKEQTWACTKDTADGRKDVGVPTADGIDVGTRDTADGPIAGAGKTSGGPALGSMRVFLSADYFFTPNVTGGVRVGFAFRGNPTDNAKFLPFHAEARGQYFLGTNPMATVGFKPYLMGSLGFAEFDAAVPDIVAVPAPNSFSKADDPAGCKTPGGSCRVSGIKAYRLAGRTFVGLGGGFWYMLSPKFAVNVGAKLLLPFPTFSIGIAPEVGIKLSF